MLSLSCGFAHRTEPPTLPPLSVRVRWGLMSKMKVGGVEYAIQSTVTAAVVLGKRGFEKPALVAPRDRYCPSFSIQASPNF